MQDLLLTIIIAGPVATLVVLFALAVCAGL